MTNFKDRLDLLEHLISRTQYSTTDDRDILKLILEELRMLRGKTDESERLIAGVRASTR